MELGFYLVTWFYLFLVFFFVHLSLHGIKSISLFKQMLLCSLSFPAYSLHSTNDRRFSPTRLHIFYQIQLSRRKRGINVWCYFRLPFPYISRISNYLRGLISVDLMVLQLIGGREMFINRDIICSGPELIRDILSRHVTSRDFLHLSE